MMPTKCARCLQLTLLVLVVLSYHDGAASFTTGPRMHYTLASKLRILRQERNSRMTLVREPPETALNTFELISTLYTRNKNSYTRNKKSSVAWLMAAALRMCQKFPEKCFNMES